MTKTYATINFGIDAQALRQRLDLSERGNCKEFSMVRVPTEEEER